MTSHLMRPVLPSNRREEYQHAVIDALAGCIENSGYNVQTSPYGLHWPLHNDDYVVQIVVVVERKQ